MPNCIVTVVNDSSPIPIRALEVVFVLADGSKKPKSKGNLNVAKGSSVSVESGPVSCVKGTSTVVTVGNTRLPAKNSPSGNPCIVRVTWGLVDMGGHFFAAAKDGSPTTEAEAATGLKLQDVTSDEAD